MPISPNFCKVDVSATELLQLEAALPSPELKAGRLSTTVHEYYRRKLGEHKSFQQLPKRLACDLAALPDARGYIVVVLPPPATSSLRLATAVCSLVGHPFRLVTRWGLWQELGVDLNAEPHRFGGSGYNPLHIDMVNASDPPPLTCLFSVRTDPLGGGYTIVSNLQRAVRALNPFDTAELAKPAFQEGQFYDLFGVGQELKRFAVIAPLSNGMARVRFTAKMTSSLPPGPGRGRWKHSSASWSRRKSDFSSTLAIC